jgi:hypothetical protein
MIGALPHASPDTPSASLDPTLPSGAIVTSIARSRSTYPEHDHSMSIPHTHNATLARTSMSLRYIMLYVLPTF